ncbi:hypothetical protein FH972_024897 [Carpinus fangiana]|uniref:Uncharacterized protein n=1 Tax=Carpinus fangiana TaxID=176857 RepID=A0A5N6KZQ0_9ROSI|nr:hypothetical protein FH972_024897 [Carpinus fangiana]
MTKKRGTIYHPQPPFEWLNVDGTVALLLGRCGDKSTTFLNLSVTTQSGDRVPAVTFRRGTRPSTYFEIEGDVEERFQKPWWGSGAEGKFKAFARSIWREKAAGIDLETGVIAKIDGYKTAQLESTPRAGKRKKAVPINETSGGKTPKTKSAGISKGSLKKSKKVPATPSIEDAPASKMTTLLMPVLTRLSATFSTSMANPRPSAKFDRLLWSENNIASIQ